MKLLITGGAGFIGGNFILKQIRETDNTILNYDKLTYAGNLETLESVQNNKHYRFVHGDICDSEKVRETLASFQPDGIIHFAAESHVDRSIDGPMEFIQTNIVGTSVLLNESLVYYKNLSDERENIFRFVHISTDEVFGALGEEGKFTENTPYDPSSPYSASKASSDHLVRVWHRTFGLPTLITNCSNNYGPCQFPEKLIPLMIINAISDRPLPVYGKGENVRDWLYVEDHCEAIYSVLRNGQIGETYNIGGNCEMQNIEIVKTICRILDKSQPREDQKSYMDQITFVTDRPGHDFRYAMDITKINRELGWKPKENFESGIRKTIEWYLNNRQWWKNIQSGKYDQERLGRGNN